MPGVAEAPAVVEEPEASLFALGLQTRELVRSLVVVVLLVGLGLIWLDVLRASGGLTGVVVWGGVSVAQLIGAVVTVFLTIFVAKKVLEEEPERFRNIVSKSVSRVEIIPQLHKIMGVK